jgi:Helix-turn-helix domain
MSIRIMTWAWASELPPTPKLVLMALADIADDHGICWPSQNTLAKKCSTAERSVRRILLQLQASKLLFVESRFRPNGSQASNRYRLAIGGPPDNLSGAPWSPEVGPPDSGVQGGWTQVSTLEPPLNLQLNHHHNHVA